MKKYSHKKGNTTRFDLIKGGGGTKYDLGPRKCWKCGRNGCSDPLRHHILGGCNRKKWERYGLAADLCHSRCHENGPETAHRNAEVMLELHQWGHSGGRWRSRAGPQGTSSGSPEEIIFEYPV